MVHGRTTITVSLVVSKNRSERSCALTFASYIQRSFSEQAYQTRENSHKPQNLWSKNELVLAAPAKFSTRQTRTVSSDCLRLVTKVNLSVYMLSRKKIQHNKNNNFSSTKGTRPLKSHNYCVHAVRIFTFE